MQATRMENASIHFSHFDIPDPLSVSSLKDVVSSEEWALRCDLAATYRLCALYGWDDHVFTHISARMPDADGKKRFLLNPYGVGFDEMTASSLIIVDEDGAVLGDTPYFSNPAGFVIHSAIHMARGDAHCVLHLHSAHGTAVSAQPDGLLPITQFAMIVHDDLAYHDYEGIATDLEEREVLVRDIGNHGCLMLRNHGTLTVGENCAVAFLRMYYLEQACKTQILAQAGTKPPLQCAPDMSAKVGEQGSVAFMPGVGDNLVWPAFLRRLKRVNPGWDV